MKNLIKNKCKNCKHFFSKQEWGFRTLTNSYFKFMHNTCTYRSSYKYIKYDSSYLILNKNNDCKNYESTNKKEKI